MKPSQIPKSADIVIVGGGIIGVSTAYFLAKKGIRTVVCEKGEIAGEQSSRNWGFIRKQGRNPLELPLMIRSQALWHELVKALGVDIGFYTGGTLYLSETEKRFQANLAWMEHAKTFDLDSRMLTIDALQDLIPGIQNQSLGALYTPSDARAEPAIATLAISDQAKLLGATAATNCAVRGIDIEAGNVAGVVTEHGRIRASTVVCAGGAWSGYFCRHLDLVFPHLKVISSVMSTVPTELVTQQSIWSNGLGLRRRLDGGYNVAYGGRAICDLTPDFIRFFSTFLPAYKDSKESVSLRLGKRFLTEFGWPSKWSFDEVTPFEKERALNPKPNGRLLAKAYQLLGETFPSLKGVAINQRWAGMIDVTPDELPVISTVSTTPGLIISTGYSGHGFGIGLGAGEATADLARGKSPAVDISAFSLNRLLE